MVTSFDVTNDGKLEGSFIGDLIGLYDGTSLCDYDGFCDGSKQEIL